MPLSLSSRPGPLSSPLPLSPSDLGAMPSLSGPAPAVIFTGASPLEAAPIAAAANARPAAQLTALGARLTQPEARRPAALDLAFDRKLSAASADPEPVAGAPAVPPDSGLEPFAPRGQSGPAAAPPRSQPPRKAVQAVSWVPHLLTSLNLVSGLAALALASSGQLLPAAGLILLANLFDALDGKAARALGVSGPLGLQLDSLADVVSFGAAPALLIGKASLFALGPAGFVPAAVFACAGMYRLARFNLGASAPDDGKPHADSFTGLPIPGGAGVIIALWSVLPLLPAALAPWIAAGVTLTAAGAMVSTFPYPAFKQGGLRALTRPLLAAIALSGALAAVGSPRLIPAALFGAYLLSGPLIRFYKGGSEVWKTELKRKAFHQLILGHLALALCVPYPLNAALAGAWCGVVAAVELIRLRADWAKPFFDRWFKRILRDKEVEKFSGSFYVASGLAIALLLFGWSPALSAGAVLALAWGDAVSPLVGMRFGWLPYKAMGTARSVDGTAAGFLTALTIGLLCGFSPGVALGAAAAFSVVDIFPVKPNDNFWIPIVFPAALYLLSLF